VPLQPPRQLFTFASLCSKQIHDRHVRERPKVFSALELYSRMTTMAPAYPHAWWERARLELVDHDVASARRSLSAMLEITRDLELRRRVTETLHALPAD
jgi:hypothetical protein